MSVWNFLRQCKLLVYSLPHIRLVDFVTILARGSKDYTTIKLNGLPIQMRPNSPDLKTIYENLVADEFKKISESLTKNFDGVIIDAGGYIGTSAIAFSLKFPHSTIISVEPSFQNFQLLKENVKSFDNILALNAALSCQKNQKISLYDRGTGQWGFTTVDQPPENNANLIETVPTITLKELRDQFGTATVLKLDIEGGEYELLKNSRSELEKIDFIYIELHQRIRSEITEVFNGFIKDKLVCRDGHEKFLISNL